MADSSLAHNNKGKRPEKTLFHKGVEAATDVVTGVVDGAKNAVSTVVGAASDAVFSLAHSVEKGTRDMVKNNVITKKNAATKKAANQ